MKRIIFFVFITSISSVFSQNNLWRPIDNAPIAKEDEYAISTSEAEYYHFDLNTFRNLVKSNSVLELDLPMGNGQYVKFQLHINTTMDVKLRHKFPNIMAFDGISTNNYKAKVDIGPNYFRAMILRPGKATVFIDPAVFTKKYQEEYIVYSSNHFLTNKEFTCNFKSENINSLNDFESKAIQTCELRTYRVAIAATGEYVAFQGGTVAQALAAQVTTLNRVNGIYERDLAITMTLIGNNDTLIYVDANTDPYTNGSPDQMIDENIANVNQIIGASNYDIGHVFGTDSGGLAYLNCVCKDNMKAGGVTGSSAPFGDPFDVDYVAHEMGHEFGANHSFNNSCSGNRNNGTAYETGSGSTIMGYAGVCNPNVQLHSDAYFHAISLQEIGTAISNVNHTCPVKTPLSNSAPTAIISNSNFTIPTGTPFILTASATDNEGDSLTYCWEQMDKDITTQPPTTTASKGPNFRSFNPDSSNIRYVPSIKDQLQNSYTWERLSSVTRNYKFRVTVRDNSKGAGGCTDSEDMTIAVDGNSGPFKVTNPNTTGIVWTGLTQQTITWDVANTNVAPVSCQNVKILISIDGGLSFITLLASTPNDGSEDITVPNVSTDKALINITSENGTFFDISDKKFKIIASQLQVDNNKNEDFKLRLSPNPTNGFLKINFDNINYLNGYQIINSLGQVVMTSQQKITNNSSINLEGIDKGVYFFETHTQERKIIQKIIIE